MFRDMRRINQLLSKEDTDAIMKRCTNGVLACCRDNVTHTLSRSVSFIITKNILPFG